ncbi:MAG TPA: RNA 2',3'-cyclic phosphodiesterase [Patescibacteria group bacterium]|jgi:2'-5' RNA ligase|nr:RNA 2',3'-cyclic phosphodiesterase [Patescibacteria group bacterium]
MRAFLAIEMPANIQDILYRTSLNLGDRITPRAAVRWVRADNIHLTLRFLGNIRPDLIPEIGHTIDQNVASFPMFDLEFEELGCFPKPEKPRIIWVGIGGAVSPLNQLHAIVERELKVFGWEPEVRPFHPHLTIGRVKDSGRVTEANLAYGLKIEAPPFSVKAISLVESILKPEGVSYMTRYKCPLKAIR